jgi:hypothetical protein
MLRLGAPHKLNGKQDALLVGPPALQAADRVVLLDTRAAGRRDGQADRPCDLSSETLRRRSTENELKPWRRDLWRIPEVDGTYVPAGGRAGAVAETIAPGTTHLAHGLVVFSFGFRGYLGPGPGSPEIALLGVGNLVRLVRKGPWKTPFLLEF